MGPQEAKTVADFLVADFAMEMQTTLGVLGAVPQDRLDYKPDAKSKSGLSLVRHITLEDEWILNCIANGEFGTPPDDSDACGIMTPADAVARYKEKLPKALDRVRAMSGEQLVKVIDLTIAIRSSACRRVWRSWLKTRALPGSFPSINHAPRTDRPARSGFAAKCWVARVLSTA